MTKTKIAALVRSEASPPEVTATTLAALVTAHASLFGFAAALGSAEELMAAGEGRAGRVIKLELDVEREPGGESGARLKLVEQSLNRVAKRAGVAASFELFVAKTGTAPRDGGSG